MEEIKKCDEIKKRRKELDSVLEKKVSELLDEAKKRGFGNQYYARYECEIEVRGEKGKAEMKKNNKTGEIYLRVKWERRGEIYYVSEFRIPPARILVEGVQVLKKVIAKFNENLTAEQNELTDAMKEAEAMRI